MTTIAWDGKTLACDRQLTQDGKRFTTTKAWRLKDGRLFASAGAVEDNIAVRDWLNGDTDKPSFKDGESFNGVLISEGHLYICNTKLKWSPIHDVVFATGSGGDYATAALRLGKSARESVEVAAEMDLWTGMGVDELMIEKSDQ